MARAIATRCCRPALKSRGSTACTRGSNPTNTSNSLILAWRAGPARVVCRSSNSPITCATVQRGLMLSSGSWNTICNFARKGRNCFSDRPASDVPWNSTSPELGCSRCSRQRPVVVLPDPLSPTKPRHSPGRMRKDTSSAACTFAADPRMANCLLSFCTSISGSASARFADAALLPASRSRSASTRREYAVCGWSKNCRTGASSMIAPCSITSTRSE